MRSPQTSPPPGRVVARLAPEVLTMIAGRLQQKPSWNVEERDLLLMGPVGARSQVVGRKRVRVWGWLCLYEGVRAGCLGFTGSLFIGEFKA